MNKWLSALVLPYLHAQGLAFSFAKALRPSSHKAQESNCSLHHYQPCLHNGIVHLQGDFSGSPEEGGIKHALHLQDAAALNPVAYLNGLAKAVTDMGGKIYEGTRVRKPDRSELQTEAGNKVR